MMMRGTTSSRAMEYGMPPMSGLGLGNRNRFVALITDRADAARRPLPLSPLMQDAPRRGKQGAAEQE